MNEIGSLFLGQTSALATIGTAIVAYSLYRKAKNDELENATRIMILEIRESEKIIKNLLAIKNSDGFYPTNLVKLVPHKAWIKYSHLFIKKLNNDEYDQVDDYFKKCDTLERYIEKSHNFFWITTEERTRQSEIVGASLASENPTLTNEQFEKEYNQRIDLYRKNTPPYSPAGIKTEMDKALNSLSLLTEMPVWNKLKSIANYSDLLG